MDCKGSETLQYAPFTTVEAHSEGCTLWWIGRLWRVTFFFSLGLRQQTVVHTKT